MVLRSGVLSEVGSTGYSAPVLDSNLGFDNRMFIPAIQEPAAAVAVDAANTQGCWHSANASTRMTLRARDALQCRARPLCANAYAGVCARFSVFSC